MTDPVFLDFSGAHSTTVDLSGKKARIANIFRLILGNKLTLALCRHLPISPPNEDGLLFWAPINTYMHKEWALLWNTGAWDSFIVARANTDAQLRAFREGGLKYPIPATGVCPEPLQDEEK